MARPLDRLLDRLRRPLARADAWMNRLYGWRGNPLYHSGVIAAALLGVVLVTGIYLIFFYRIGAPYQSVRRITENVWLGSWTRSLHRYASDAAVVAAALHAFRMLVQRRSWGPRTLAWVSGVVMLMLVLVFGWTGYVMVWDVQGQVLAQEGARLFDALPLFSEPISRTFDGSRPLPSAFFFLNLFAHVALPIGLGIALWIHVARVARPVLVPPRRLAWALLLLLAAASALLPVGMEPAADLLRTPGPAAYDLFYSFFLPLTRPLSAWAVWLLGGAAVLGVCCIPLLAAPGEARRPAPSSVDERLCTGCEQCWKDCPYEAIAMVPRRDGRSTLVAHVNPDLCTSCGICAGSCAPMGVGPPGRTGRDQLSAVRRFVAERAPGPLDVVLISCARGAGGSAARSFEGAPVLPVECAGNLHTSVVEFLIRAGAGGVLVVSCPPRDCWNREGGKWLEQRLYHQREAELHARVDRSRVRLLFAAERERDLVAAVLSDFRDAVRALEQARAESEPAVERACDLPPSAVKAR